MKILLILFCLISTQVLSQNRVEEQKIKAMLDLQVELWNKGDIPQFMESYEKSENLKFISKKGVTKGWKSTLERYLKSYPDRASMGTLRFDIQEIDLNHQTAWVLGKWDLIRPEKGDVGGYFTLVLKKIKGKWLITRDHTS